MCQICEDLGLGPETPKLKAGKTGRLTRNEDGTYSLRLSKEQLTNLLIRLAVSVMTERQT